MVLRTLHTSRCSHSELFTETSLVSASFWKSKPTGACLGSFFFFFPVSRYRKKAWPVHAFLLEVFAEPELMSLTPEQLYQVQEIK